MLNITEYIKEPKLILFGFLHKFAYLFPDKFYVQIYYKLALGKKLDLKNPQTFNEKLQWLKLYDRKPKYTQMVDKVAAKEYVANIIGEEYIIPTLGIWDKFEDIDFNELPDQFVLKTTHNSGGVFICKDKSTFDFNTAQKNINKLLRQNAFYLTREWPYKNVKPRIIAEKYMVDESKLELKDYKIFCFNGKPKLIEVDFNRFCDHKRNIYSIDWKLLDLKIKYKNDPSLIIKKPKDLKKMLELASILSKNILHLRTDFYYISGSIYFGELTFYHDGGNSKFMPDSWGYKMGSWIDLPKIKK